jgi:head-tail adaptor
VSVEAMMTQSVTIDRAATTTDRYGNTIPNWSSVTQTSATAWIAQRSADEIRNATGETSEWVGYFPAGTDVLAEDRITYGSIVFEVAGPPNQARTPWNGAAVHHVEAALRLVEG